MKGQPVRVEARLDGSVAVRFQGEYLNISACLTKVAPKPGHVANGPVHKDHNRGGRSRWMRDYPIGSSKPLWPSAAGMQPEQLNRSAGHNRPGGLRVFRPEPLLGIHHRDVTMRTPSHGNRRALPITYGAIRRSGSGRPLRRDPVRALPI